MGGWLDLISVCVVKIDNGSYYFSISKFCQTINLVFAPFSVKLFSFLLFSRDPTSCHLDSRFIIPMTALNHFVSKLCVFFYILARPTQNSVLFLFFFLIRGKLKSGSSLLCLNAHIMKLLYSFTYLTIPIIIILFKEQLLA